MGAGTGLILDVAGDYSGFVLFREECDLINRFITASPTDYKTC